MTKTALQGLALGGVRTAWEITCYPVRSGSPGHGTVLPLEVWSVADSPSERTGARTIGAKRAWDSSKAGGLGRGTLDNVEVKLGNGEVGALFVQPVKQGLHRDLTDLGGVIAHRGQRGNGQLR